MADNEVNARVLQDRTKKYALRIIRLIESLPQSATARVIGNQLLRSGTSVGANYRAACRSRTKIEFASKIGIVVEEADESLFWLELLVEANIIQKDLLENLIQETNELISIMVASGRTAKKVPPKTLKTPVAKNPKG
jgi:four helix bundle protein